MSKLPTADPAVNDEISDFQRLSAAEYLRQWRAKNKERCRKHARDAYLRRKVKLALGESASSPRPRGNRGAK